MASEIAWRHSATAKTVYATIRSSARTYWSTTGAALEALTVANWGNYDIALAEAPADSYFYVGDWPAALTTVGWYWLDIYQQAGGSPAIGDTLVGGLVAYWNGTTLDPWDADTVQVGGTTQTAGDLASLIGNIGSGTGSALNFAAVDDNVLGDLKGIAFVGTQTPGTTFNNTTADNGLRHIITDSGGVTDIDIVYKFTLGTSRRAAKVTWKGLVTNLDVIEVYAYDFVAVGWDATARKVITGTTSTANQTVDINLLEKHTGTGTEAGHVYLRFQAVGESAIVLSTDEMLALGQSIGSTTGYADGAVWVKATGTSGTTPDVNGTADNPCPWADALVVAAAKGLTRFRIENGETVELTGSIANKTLIGENWTLTLAGQAVTSAKIKGATVSGISSGTGAEWEDCHFTGTQTIGGGDFFRCGFGVTTFTMLASSKYNFVQCFDDDPDTATSPVFVWAANAVAGARAWDGAFQCNGMAGTNKLTINGSGRLILADTSEGGAITIRGDFPPVTGGVGLHSAAEFIAHGGTITQTQRFGTDQIFENTSYGDTGITLDKALEMLAAFLANKVTASSAGGVTTYTWMCRDGITISFTSVCDEDDGLRPTTGSLS